MNSSGPIKLTPEYFKIVLEQIHKKFLNTHHISKLPKAFQLYGYGSFDESKPNLKSDLEKVGSQFINGKYLYDKAREIEKGKSYVKLNEYYTSIVLLYIGYDNFRKFFEDFKLSDEDSQNQLALIKDDNENATHYYVNYYFGEDNIIIKGQTIISNNWKKIQHIFLYPLEDGTFRKHYSHGTIGRQGDTIFIRTKTLSGGRYIDGASEIYYTGHKASSNIRYLIGTYCNFDVYTNTVAGRSILEKYDTKEEMEEHAQSQKIPPFIAQEIRNQRIENVNSVAKHHMELSDKSPYSAIYGKIPGFYEIKFDFGQNSNETVQFRILSSNYKITIVTDNVYIEDDRIELLNKGSVINFSFNLSGIIALERVNIYFKTYYLKNGDKLQPGVFSGIDNENRLIHGTLSVNYKADK